MAIPLTEVKELPRNELIELVAELWEVRHGWRTICVESGDVIQLEVNGDSLEIDVPQVDDHQFSDVDVSIDILAIQEDPYAELEFIHVRQDTAEPIEDTHLFALDQMANGSEVEKSVIVTTSAGPEMTVEEQLYKRTRVVDGAELCNLIDQYVEYGFDYDTYFDG